MQRIMSSRKVHKGEGFDVAFQTVSTIFVRRETTKCVRHSNNKNQEVSFRGLALPIYLRKFYQWRSFCFFFFFLCSKFFFSFVIGCDVRL